jgi:hypothetical protein
MQAQPNLKKYTKGGQQNGEDYSDNVHIFTPC